MLRLGLAALLTTLVGCMPPSVKVVDELLKGLEEDDVNRAQAAVHPEDRALLEAGMRAGSSHAVEALALPPRPLEHEMVEIAEKAEDHHVVVADLRLKNPLPFASERLGQEMPDMPKTRPLTMRFRSERLADGDWAVRLDLPATVARSRFVQRFQAALDQGRLEDAAEMLEEIPPSPQTAQAQEEADRLEDSLRAALDAARKKTTAESIPNGSTEAAPPAVDSSAP